MAAPALPAPKVPPEEQPQTSPTSPTLFLELGSLAVDSCTRSSRWHFSVSDCCSPRAPAGNTLHCDPCVTGILVNITVSSCSQSSG